jgi:hypothetical protein
MNAKDFRKCVKELLRSLAKHHYESISQFIFGQRQELLSTQERLAEVEELLKTKAEREAKLTQQIADVKLEAEKSLASLIQKHSADKLEDQRKIVSLMENCKDKASIISGIQQVLKIANEESLSQIATSRSCAESLYRLRIETAQDEEAKKAWIQQHKKVMDGLNHAHERMLKNYAMCEKIRGETP